jgi:hypothetical protein
VLVADAIKARDAMMQAAGAAGGLIGPINRVSQAVFNGTTNWQIFTTAVDSATRALAGFSGAGMKGVTPEQWIAAGSSSTQGYTSAALAQASKNQQQAAAERDQERTSGILAKVANEQAIAQQRRDEINQQSVAAAKKISGAFEDAAKNAASALEGAINKIPGLLGLSSVTDLDMKKAAAGLSVRYPDSYVREAKDELMNGKDYANIDPAEVAKSVGLDLSVGADLIVAELERQWASGEYFVNPDNLLKVDWEAYKTLMQQEANASLGASNLIAEAMKQGITPESWKAATEGTGPLIVAGVQSSLDAADMTSAAKAFGTKLDSAFADTGSEAYTSAYGAGEALAQTINAGFAATAGLLNWGVPVTGGTPAGDTTTPPAKAIGTSYWTGGAMRVHKDETIVLPRGSAVYTARETASSGGGNGASPVNIYNSVQTPITVEMVAQKTLQLLKRRSG